MNRRRKYLIGLFGLLFLLASMGLWLVPRLVAALPSTYRQRLPTQLIRMVTTPLPTALPAPGSSVSQDPIVIPTIIWPTATAENRRPTVAPTTTLAPTVGVIEETTVDVQSVTPTPTLPPSPTATSAPTLTPTPTVPPLPSSVLLEGLEIVPQKFNNCGPTNLSINLRFYGHIDPQLEIAAVLKPNPDDRNVGPEEMVRYVNENTPLRATLHSGGDLELLKRLIAAGFPVVIEKGLKPSEWEGWMGHYLTLYGYDDGAEVFYSLDTFLGPWDGSGRTDSYAEIDREWGHFNDTFFVVYPSEEEAIIDEILGPDYLNPTSMWHGALLKAQTETGADPDNAFAWFNLGTSLTELGALTGQAEFYQSAAAAFDRAREIGLPARMLWYQFDLYEAYLAVGRIDDVLVLADVTLSNEGGQNVEETYLYRGHALLARGNVNGARVAYRQALSLNPQYIAARRALESLAD